MFRAFWNHSGFSFCWVSGFELSFLTVLWNLSPGGLHGRQRWAGKREHPLGANLLLQLCSFGGSSASCKVILFGHQVEIKATDQRPRLRERYNTAFCDSWVSALRIPQQATLT